MTVITKSDFARHINRSHQYVSSLIKQGRIVLSKDNGREMVELEASLAKITATADPANNPATTMPRSDGRTMPSVGMALRVESDTDGGNTQHTSTAYQKSRAVKENYAARLRKIEYEEKMGTVVNKQGVEKAAFGVSRILREKLKSLPHRIAPKVTVVTDQKENFKILTDEVENVIKEIQTAISEIINT
jgi:hypothetical protein